MKTIRGRLVVNYLILVTALVVLVWAGTVWATRSTFESYVAYQQSGRALTLLPALEQFWERQGSWDGVAAVLSRAVMGGRGQGMGGWMRMGGQRTESAALLAYRAILRDSQDNVVYDGYPEGGPVPDERWSSATPILADGVKVGTVLVTGTADGVLGDFEETFLDSLKLVIGAIALASIVLGLLLSLRFSKDLSRPIERLSGAAAGLAGGLAGSKVELEQSGAPSEISNLVDSFNSMSSQLALSDAKRVDMLRDISHEIRTPLTILSGNLEAVSTGVIKMDSETIATLSGEIDRLRELVKDLDRLEQVVEGGSEGSRLSPVSLVERAYASVQGAAASKGILVEMKVSPGLPDVWADKDHVQQVFANILSNALRYTPAKGTVAIRAEEREGSDSGSKEVLFSITDTGPGIPPEHLSRIFERLFRGDASRARSTGGSGLGLAIAKGLVEGWKGTIWAENVGSGGAAFYFTVPVATLD